jgi:hypothetical protein
LLKMVPAQFLQNPSLPTCFSSGGFKHKFKNYLMISELVPRI